MAAYKGAKHLLEREKWKPIIIAWLAEGRPTAEIAKALSNKNQQVTQRAVELFRKRHAAEIEPVTYEIERQITDYAIAQKVNRVADAQLRRDLLVQVKEGRAKGGTGMETGIVARQYKMIGSGDNATVVEEYKVDTAMLAEWRNNDRAVAEELAQLPRPNINIDASSKTYVLHIEGADPTKQLG